MQKGAYKDAYLARHMYTSKKELKRRPYKETGKRDLHKKSEKETRKRSDV